MSEIERTADRVLRLLFPRVCPVCEEILTEKNRSEDNPYICKYCHQQLQFVTDPYCMKCGAPIDDPAEEYCANCQGKEKHYDQGMALLVHDDNARKMLYDLKYAGRKDNADFLGLEAARKLGKDILFRDPEVILPVPLHKRRQFERGFNQAGLLADRISFHIRNLYGVHLPVDHTYLIRNKKTTPQKELDDSQRAENVRGKFCISSASDAWQFDDSEGMKQDCPYKTVLLLDDIYTSGATINECASVLKKAGVREVLFLTMSIVG